MDIFLSVLNYIATAILVMLGLGSAFAAGAIETRAKLFKPLYEAQLQSFPGKILALIFILLALFVSP